MLILKIPGKENKKFEEATVEHISSIGQSIVCVTTKNGEQYSGILCTFE